MTESVDFLDERGSTPTSPFGKGGPRGICPNGSISKSPLTPLCQREGLRRRRKSTAPTPGGKVGPVCGRNVNVECRRAWALVVALALAVVGCRNPVVSQLGASDGAHLTDGIAAGEVTSSTAVVWGRCDQPALLQAVLKAKSGGPEQVRQVAVDAGHDFTGKVLFDGLAPATAYEYRVWCHGATASRDGEVAAARGVFRTAPAAEDPRPVRFVWSGDLAGQNACRDAREGYTVLDRVAEQSPDFFIGLGDMIYADDRCAAIGRYGNRQIVGPKTPSLDLAGFWAHWRYNRVDPASQRLLASTAYYGVWDDHEVMSDFGPHHDTLRQAPRRHLLPIGLQAFLDYQPMIPPAAAPKRLYRRIRWGKEVELFFLDTRQYRDANILPDTGLRPKTMLGAAQRQWLIDGLTHSDATWKVVVCSVPLSIPTGNERKGHDGWAAYPGQTGFERELLSILRELELHHVRNQVWITTDVHFATVFRYTPFPEDAGFQLHEFTTGPLNAGVFPRPDLAPTLHPERLFFNGPESADAIKSFDEAKHWFTFSVVDIDEDGDLTLRIVNGVGKTVYRLALEPQT